MTAVTPKFETGPPISYTCVEALTGGTLVERRTGVRKVGKAAAGSVKVCGVARQDVIATRVRPGDIIVDQENGLAVDRGCVIPVVYSGAANPGDKLIAATGGKVAAAGATPDARTVVGECFELAADGETKLARIY